MKSNFDRPTLYTLGSTYVVPATKMKLVAEVGIKNQNQKGIAPSVWLQPQVSGGPRQPKQSEILLRRKSILPGGMFMVPGAGAKFDSYGNVSRGQISQILSALGGFGETGFLANKSFRRGARMNKQTSQIFVGKPNGKRGPLGIYQRTAEGHLIPLMIFVNQPNYRPRLPFYQVAQDVYIANFQTEFNDALKIALASSAQRIIAKG